MSLNIFNLFARSPIRPLQQHIDKAHAAAAAQIPFIDAVIAVDWDEALRLQRHIDALENEADRIKKDLRLHLPKGLFLPVSRGDLLQILVEQDKLANKAQDIAGLILGRHMVFPAEVAQPYRAFLKRCIDAAHQADRAIHELDELLETGFRGNEVLIVEKTVLKLDRIESDTDALQVQIRHILFSIEKEMSPIDAMFLYKIIDRTGVIANIAQTIGGRLQQLVAQ